MTNIDIGNENELQREAVNDNTWKTKCVEFSIHFTGDQLDKHQIDAKQYAKTINAIADSIICAHKLENGENSNIQVNVSGEVRPGSLIVDLITIASGIDYSSIIDVISPLGFAGVSVVDPDPNCLKNTISNVIELFQWLKGRIIEKRTPTTINGKQGTIIQTGNESKVVYNNCIFNIADNEENQKHLKKIAESIDGTNIKNIDFNLRSNNNTIPVSLSPDDKEHISPIFREEEEGENSIENEQEAWLYVTHAGTGGYKSGWGFGYELGKETFSKVTIEDEEFIKMIHEKEIGFYVDTQLKVRLQIIQKKMKNKTSTSYKVLEVLEIAK